MTRARKIAIARSSTPPRLLPVKKNVGTCPLAVNTSCSMPDKQAKGPGCRYKTIAICSISKHLNRTFLSRQLLCNVKMLVPISLGALLPQLSTRLCQQSLCLYQETIGSDLAAMSTGIVLGLGQNQTANSLIWSKWVLQHTSLQSAKDTSLFVCVLSLGPTEGQQTKFCSCKFSTCRNHSHTPIRGDLASFS